MSEHILELQIFIAQLRMRGEWCAVHTFEEILKDLIRLESL